MRTASAPFAPARSPLARPGRPVGPTAAALLLALAALLPLPAGLARAQDPAPAPRAGQAPAPKTGGGFEDVIQITAQRIPESVLATPAGVTVISGDELRQRGVRDLATALAGVGGVSIAPGGDGGPAASVPEFMGLREFDAFLLVVDGVPSGGAFNPALATLDLTNVNRIEVLRGAAPVPFGATSFVGVIHVIHNDAEHAGRSVRVTGGSHGSFGAGVTTTLPGAALHQSISADFDRLGFDDGRAQTERRHVRWSGDGEAGGGGYQLGADLTLLDQDPTSPHLREDGQRSLSSRIPLDSNFNPVGAKLDENRLQLSASYSHALGAADWSNTLSWTHSRRDSLRGFLRPEQADDGNNADGFGQKFNGDDLYLDSHLVWNPLESLALIGGLDLLGGRGKAESQNFEYRVDLDAKNAPRAGGIQIDERPTLEDQRLFGGVYLQGLWNLTQRLRFEGGLRYNRTYESQKGEVVATDPGDSQEASVDRRNERRFSGSAGLSFLAFSTGSDSVWLYSDYRDTFKPAAIDFGPEAEGDILDSETAQTLEAGLKGTQFADRFIWQIGAFQTNFENLVIAQDVGGLPSLTNAGKQRFRGLELQGRVRLPGDLTLDATYARHQAEFRDFATTFGDDTQPVQLRGNRLELSAKHLASLGVSWTPASGPFAYVAGNYVGSRFLDKRNTAPAGDFTTLGAGFGYRVGSWELRVDGTNLTDRRDPVSESELGESAYYRMPGRAWLASVIWHL